MTERRQYCPKGHDTFECGRDSSYRCLRCKREAGQAARDAREAERAAERAHEQDRWNERAREQVEANRRQGGIPRPSPGRVEAQGAGLMSPRRACNGWIGTRPCPEFAVPGTSRCSTHSGGWDRYKTKHPERTAGYRESEYARNRKVLLQGHPRCRWCGVKPATTADHLVAVAQGGDHSLENLVPACGRCNQIRGASLGGQVTKARRQKT